MTVRVTALKGDQAGCYYTERLPSYYLDGDEPPGRWHGRATSQLGLAGDVDAGAFEALLAGCDPKTGRVLGRRFGDDSVRGYDVTFSAPKSVSVLFGVGDAEVRRHVAEGHDRAVAAVLGWVEEHAHTRMRQRGHVICVDAEGVATATFRQHTSRSLDPQVHAHAVVANRVEAPDGRWLALDARTLMKDQRTLSGLYHASLRSELTRRFGVVWQPPVNGIAEMVGVDEAILAEFSQRTKDMQRRLDIKLARFRVELSREPTHQERWKLGREAALDSRPHKPKGHSVEDLHEWWQRRLADHGLSPEALIDAVAGRARRSAGIDASTAARMVDDALTVLSEKQSTWRPELVRELAATVPTAATVDPDELTAFLQRLADHAVEYRCVDLTTPVPGRTPLRRDGRPVTEAAIQRTLTTQGILDEEQQIIDWAESCRRVSDAIPPRQRRVPGDRDLSQAQSEACSSVANGSSMELIVGPAGAGKTTALAPAVAYRQSLNLGVFGVAPTAAAADVLATETGVAADTLDKLLHEHRQPNRPPEAFYDLPGGTAVIVDEAGTVSTPRLAELVTLAEQRAWRIVLVGDPRQFSAVGRGGMFDYLIRTYGAIELDQVHRFTHEWERRASLGIRNGNPAALAEYDRHGRLHDGTSEAMEAAILGAWSAARDRGETVALMANSNDTVDRLNNAAQEIRIARGDLDPTGPTVQLSGRRLFVGDEVVTRRNDRTLRTDQGGMVKNRDHWTVRLVHSDRSLTLEGSTGTVRLPAEYAAKNLDLGYARTAHATQGRTVDIGLVLIDGPVDQAGVYTPMTRGRHANHAYVVTDDNHSAADILAQALARHWIDKPAVARRSELGPHEARQPGEPGSRNPEVDELLRHIERITVAREQRLERDPTRSRAPRGPSLGR